MRTSIGRIDGDTYLTDVYYAPFAMLSPLLVSNLGVVIANEGDVGCIIYEMSPTPVCSGNCVAKIGRS